jgi:hypothetical protein
MRGALSPDGRFDAIDANTVWFSLEGSLARRGEGKRVAGAL